MHSVEQQIYASLAIEGLKAGHHTHAATPGLSSSAVERHEEICNRWGSYEPGADFTRALVHAPLWLDEAPPAAPSHHVVVLITYQGRDAGGRPGAVLRHIVRMPSSHFEKLDFNPFHLLRSGRLLESWQPNTPFPAIADYADGTSAEDLQGIFPERYPLLRAMLEQILDQGQLHLPAPADSPAAEEMLAQLYELVPLVLRRGLSLATFAYNRPREYRLATFRQEDASFRKSLKAIQTAKRPQLEPAAAEYVDRLFAALKAKDWNGARGVIRSYEPPDQPATDTLVAESIVEEGGSGFDTPTPSGVRHGVAAPPPEMPYQKHWSQERRSGRGRMVAAVVAVLAIVAIGIWLSTRGGSSSSPGGGRRASQLTKVEGENLQQFLSNNVALLEGMLAGGSRDFDIGEELAAATPTWDERASRALDGEFESMDETITRVSSRDWAEVPSALRAAASRIDEVARRCESLGRIVRTSAANDLRSRFDVATGVLDFDGARGELEGPMAGAASYSEGLLAAAEALSQWVPAAEGRDIEAWSAAAAALSGAVDVFGAALPPQVVAASAGLAGSMVDVLAAERPSQMRAWALAVPYQASRLQGGDLEEATSRLRGYYARFPATVPQPVAVIERFYTTLWDAVAPALADNRADASVLLETLANLCESSPDPCTIDHYAAHVARWKLEAWRRAPAPASAAAQELYAKLGDAALADGSFSDLVGVLPLVARMEQASIPASADLVGDVQRARGRVARGFYRSLYDDWLARNQRGAQSEQQAFQGRYERLASELAALRSASGDDAGAAFARLRSSLSDLDEAELGRAEAAGEGGKVAAVRALRSACSAPQDFRVQRIELHLQTETDYAGTRRPLARLRVQLKRLSDGAVLLEFEAPPMLAAPGVGFDAITVDVGQDVSLAPGDELLLLATDSSDGVVWFHRRIQASRGRHVAETLAGLETIQVDPGAARQFADGSGSPPASDDGDTVARVRFVLGDGWWSDYAAALPTLP